MVKTVATVLVIGLIGLAAGVWIRNDGDGPASKSAITKQGPNRSRLPKSLPRGIESNCRLRNVAATLGVRFDYQRGETGEYWLPETMGGGVGWIDFDGDRRLDLYFTQGGQFRINSTEPRPPNVLYRNLGPRMVQVPSWAAPSDIGYGMGVAVADYDNDGFDDVFVANFGRDMLYRNNGDGTFSADTESGIVSDLFATSAAFGDLDRDGDLEIYVANYVKCDPEIQCIEQSDQKRKYCGPDYYQAQQDALYENTGEGGFRDSSAVFGIVRPEGKGLGVIIADLVGEDGWPDVFVANDLRPNFLFNHVGADATTPYEEVGMESGAAVNGEGLREANMGIACGDIDENGLPDIYVTHYYMEHDTFWSNIGNGFVDSTKRFGLSLPTLRQLSWGTNFIDCDNDSLLDIFVTSGHINDTGGIPYAMYPQLFRQTMSEKGRRKFEEVSASVGDYFQSTYVGRSSASGDFNNDGALDIAVGHHHKPAAILSNESEGLGNSVGFELIGRRSNRSAIGAKVKIQFSDGGQTRTLVREVLGGGSYLAANSNRILIGLGTVEQLESVEVHWPSGQVDLHEGVVPGSYWVFREGDQPGQRYRFEPQKS